MRGDITIVMYHYVRNLKKSSYPRIKGLDTKKFARNAKKIIVDINKLLNRVKVNKKNEVKSKFIYFYN